MYKKNKPTQMTLEEFTKLYSTPYLTNKYGDDWVSVALEEQFKHGIRVQIVEKPTSGPSTPTRKSEPQFNNLDLTWEIQIT